MMDTNALLALQANMVIEDAMQAALDDCRGIKRQLIIDLETSGLTPETGDIIRFRAVNPYDPDDEFDEPVKPSRPMSAEAERITGTTNERLSCCRSVDFVLNDFLDFIDGAELLGGNLEFDLMFLDAAEAAISQPLLMVRKAPQRSCGPAFSLASSQPTQRPAE